MGDGNGKGHFLIATPEKAVVDYVHFFCSGREPQALLRELIDHHRFTIEDLKNLDNSLVQAISMKYGSKAIHTFTKTLAFL